MATGSGSSRMCGGQNSGVTSGAGKQGGPGFSLLATPFGRSLHPVVAFDDDVFCEVGRCQQHKEDAFAAIFATRCRNSRFGLRCVTASSAKDHVSEGSGKKVHVHFCENCGTKLFLTFERFKGVVGVYGGTLDDPNWLKVSPDNSKHIFLGVAQNETVIPAQISAFMEHATLNDGTPVTPLVFDKPQKIGDL